jgi:hypothetical protein
MTALLTLTLTRALWSLEAADNLSSKKSSSGVRAFFYFATGGTVIASAYP